MNKQAQTSPAPLPRHYYQVALDFGRLSKRISSSLQVSGHCARIKVRNPATVLSDWETAFQDYSRPLANLFHHLSSKVLAQHRELKHLDTVRALVPLEQQVYHLLTLRNIVQYHSFPQGWQRGQDLFLARIDKILSDLQRIFTCFSQALNALSAKGSSGTHSILDNEIECVAQTTAYHRWCHSKGCFSAHVYFSQQGIGSIHTYCLGLCEKIMMKISLHKRDVPLCNS